MAGNKGKSQKVKVKSKKSKPSSSAKATEGKKFPHIFRKIAAVSLMVSVKTLWRWLILIIIVSVLLLQLVRLGQTLFHNYYQAQLKKAEKQAIEAEIAKWQQVVTFRPNYRDAYFELAVLSYRLDRIGATKRYLAKVFELDPNYQPARELEKVVNK